MLAINLDTPDDILFLLKTNFKEKRLYQNLTQEGLANRSGVSLGSIKRFESSGQIALESLLKISLVLDCLNDFKNIATIHEENPQNIEELLREKKKQKEVKSDDTKCKSLPQSL